jgi:pilus assembly protein FimV
VIKPASLLRLVSAAALALPVLAQAAGLGKLTVGSYLGQPLRAEIEIVSLQPGEEASLEARLASGNAFAQAGIEFNAALNTMQFVVDKRGGRPVIVVSTRQPVNEPFLDVLVELRWSTGLFVREYTILLDPPGYEGPKPQPSAAAAPAAPERAAAAPPAGAAPSERAPSAPTASEITPAPRVAERPMEAAAPSAVKPAATEPKPAATEPKPAATESPAAAPAAAPTDQAPQAPQTYEVKKGDTLGEIALRYRPSGITYHQMLIALQRANEDAFIRSNINLVRAGRILAIPDAETASAVDPADANRLVFAQHADFADYRSRLATAVATAPAKPPPAEQSAAGPITVQPESPKPAAPTDQLKLSRADTKKPAAAKAAREDNLAASQRALQEAQSRVAELEKNVGDLKKLLEIRDQQLAQLQEKAAKPAPAPPVVAKAPEAKPAAPSAPTPAPKPVAEAPKPAAEAPKPAAPPAPVAEAPKPAPEAPKPAAAPPAPAKPTPRPIAPPPPEPSFLDELLEDPVTAFGGIGLVVLLLGGYGYWAWQRKKKSVAKFKDSVLGTASLAPAAGAGAAAAAGPVSVSQASVSQSAAGGVDADDVDPIAEADVYMAYGRDAQAEEILKEALQRDPNRLAVHAKLLEIYANRRDAQAFEQTALKLKGATGGAGPEWDKAMALGRSIDPANGLYGGAGETTPVPVPAFAVAAAAAPAVDFDIGGGTASEPTLAAAPSIDLDIGGSSAAAGEERSDFAPGGTLIIDNEDSKAATSGLDFDLGGAGDKAPESAGGLNFELPASAPARAPAPEPTPAPAAALSSGGLDFDLNLGGGGESREASSPALDLSAISLDLGTPAESAAGGGGNGDPKWQEVATKLDLAKAYEEMGDKDGARELLNEVLREGDTAQQGQANQLLAKLG